MITNCDKQPLWNGGNWYVPEINRPTPETILKQSRFIQPLPCQNENGQYGVCMFAQKCTAEGGINLGTCKDGFYIGSCCQLKEFIKTNVHTSVTKNQETGPISSKSEFGIHNR